MKGKQLFFLLFLAALAGGAWYYFTQQNGQSGSGSGGGSKVLDFPINDVARIKIKEPGTELNLVKKGDGWVVQERADYPANFESVSKLLRTLWELKTVQEVKVGPSQMPRLELVEPGKGDNAGTLVECLGADGKTLTALLLGKKYVRKTAGDGSMDMGGAMPQGRYVKPLDGTKVSLVSEVIEDADAKPGHWLAKDFVKIDGAKSIAVTGQTPAATWSVTRDNASADWKLADAKPDESLDKNKTFPLNNVFANASFEDVLAPDAKPAETGLDKPTVATIETFDGFHYELKIGKLSGEGYPVLVSVNADLPKERMPGKDEKAEDKAKLDEEFKTKQKQLAEKLAAEQKLAGRAFLVAKFTVDPLQKERSAYLPDKPAAPATSAPGATPAPGAAGQPEVPPPAKEKVDVVTPPLTIPPPSAPTPATPTPTVPAPAPATPVPASPSAPAPAPAPTEKEAPAAPANPPPSTPAKEEKPARPPAPDPATPEKPAENPPPKP